MKFVKFLQVVAICGGLLGLENAKAAVVTFDRVGDMSSILYSTTIYGAALSATVKFTLTDLQATSATFKLFVKNDSTGPGKNELMSFGIDTVSPLLASAMTSELDWGASLGSNFPGFQHVDLCVYASSGCAGGAIFNGLAAGSSDTFSLFLKTTGSFTPGGISFTSPYSVKFQDVGGIRSVEFEGCIVGKPECGRTVIQAIPEPASIALLGLGLLGVALARRRRQTS